MKHLFKSQSLTCLTIVPFAIVESVQVYKRRTEIFTKNTPVGHDEDLSPVRLEPEEGQRFIQEWESYLAETTNKKEGA